MVHKLLQKYKGLPIQLRASVWFLVCNFLQKGITTISTPIFTRLLTTEQYGNFGVFNSWLGIITIIITLHLYSGVYTQGLVKFDKEKHILSSSLQGLTTVMVLVWLGIYLVAMDFWNGLLKLTTVQMLCMFVMIWATNAFLFWSAEQRVEYKYRALVIITAVVSVAKPVVGIIFVLLAEDKVTARVLGLALVELVGYCGLFIAQMKRGKKFFSKRFWLYALGFNLPLVPHYLSQIVLSSSDRIMIKNMISADAAGIYALAYSISQIMTLFSTALSQTISPWMYQKIKQKKVQDIGPIMYLSLYMIAGVNLLCILVAPEAVAIFAPKAYHEAIWVIPPVAMSVALMYSYDFFARFEFYYEKTKFVMLASVTGAALNILLNYIFIGMYGYMAAGYTTLVCYFVYVVLHFWNMSRICKKEFPGVRVYSLPRLAIFYGAFFLIGFGLMATYNFPIARYSILGAVLIAALIKHKLILEKVRLVLKLKKSQQKNALNKGQTDNSESGTPDSPQTLAGSADGNPESDPVEQ